MTTFDSGTSYLDRLKELEGINELPEQENADLPVPGPDEVPTPTLEAPAEPDPTPEVVPPQVPEWAETLLQQQTAILEALQKVPEQKNPPAAQPSPAVYLKPLDDKLQNLQSAFANLEKSNVDVLRDSKNFQADSRMKMEKELGSYHKLFAEDVFAPILTEMAKIYITCQKCINSLEDEKLRDNLEGLLLDSMQELFEDNGVEMNQTAVGKERSLRTCKTRKTIPTGSEALHGAVAESLNPSFCLGRMVLVKELVDTYVFDPALKPVEQETSAEETALDTEGTTSEVEETTTDIQEATLENVPAETTETTSE